MSDPCPHCGSEDYGPVNEGHEHACLTCGYDTEHGTLGVCPGGLHPRDGKRWCKPCHDRMPRDLPGHPRWRSTLRRFDRTDPWGATPIVATAWRWLREHPTGVVSTR